MQEKWVGISKARVQSITATDTGVTVAVRGAPNEIVTLTFAHQMAKQQSMLHVLLVRIVQPVFQFHRKYVTKIKLFTLQAVVAEKLRKNINKSIIMYSTASLL